MTDVGTQKDEKSTPLVERVQATKLVCRQIRTLKGRVVMGWELSTGSFIIHTAKKSH